MGEAQGSAEHDEDRQSVVSAAGLKKARILVAGEDPSFVRSFYSGEDPLFMDLGPKRGPLLCEGH